MKKIRATYVVDDEIDQNIALLAAAECKTKSKVVEEAFQKILEERSGIVQEAFRKFATQVPTANNTATHLPTNTNARVRRRAAGGSNKQP